MRERDYAYEALAEVTSTDPNTGRGQLNAALRDIRTQEPTLAATDDSYLLGAEIHDRAKLYRQVFEGVALTPNALAKHWLRVKEEASKKKRGGTNLHVGETKPMPPRRKENLEHAQSILKMLAEKNYNRLEGGTHESGSVQDPQTTVPARADVP